MKNIHVLPTENSSRLSYNKDGVLELHRLQWRKNTQNIYITSNEEIKEGEWFYSPKLVDAQKFLDRRDWRKIILTTDQALIKDGVQAIDDEFLEWFVNNPSCEFIETDSYKTIYHTWLYKIILPVEEPKQETLEEVVNNFKKTDVYINEIKQEQDKNKYSEEEVEDLIYKVCGTVARLQGITLNGNHIDTAYKKFKKK
jgi:hypothetical protein